MGGLVMALATVGGGGVYDNCSNFFRGLWVRLWFVYWVSGWLIRLWRKRGQDGWMEGTKK